MTDLEILIRFRQAEAAGTLYKLTKSTHDCANSNCDRCIASSACHAIADMSSNDDFYVDYRAWARRTRFQSLKSLQQAYPECFL